MSRRKRRSVILVSACAGLGVLLLSALVGMKVVSAYADRTFELRIYHAVPGKLSVMEARFRDRTSKILERHDLRVVGYWTAESDNTFVFLLAHESRSEAAKNWRAFASDPEFQEIAKAEQLDKTLDKSEVIWLEPTDFSRLK